MLVEVEHGIKLRLLRQQFLQPRAHARTACHLGLVIGEGLLLPFDFALLFFRAAIEAAQDMLDTGYRARGLSGLRLA